MDINSLRTRSISYFSASSGNAMQLCLALFFCLTLMSSANAQISFTNENQLLSSTNRSGVALAVVDMNGDQLDDIIRLSQGNTLKIEYQASGGGTFSTYTYGSIDAQSQWSICIGDIDNNGYNDILTGDVNNSKILKANGSGTNYTLSTLPSSIFFAQGANFADINNDGAIDAFICNDDGLSKIYNNNGSGSFSTANSWINMATSPSSDNSGNYASIWTDFDNDGDLDLYISKCRAGVNSTSDPRRINALFVNDGNNNFTEQASTYGLKIGWQSWATDFADIDNDGDLDAFVLNHDHENQLFENNGSGVYTEITAGSGLVSVGFPIQGIMRDFDNDGFVDILVAGTDHLLFHNNGNKTFTQVSNVFNSNEMESFAIGDLNNDGFLDVYGGYANIFTSPSNIDDVLWMNTGNNNNYFKLNLIGTTSNKNAIGARVAIHGSWGVQIREVRSGESYGIMNSFIQHFGLGAATQIDQLVITWPSGLEQIINNPSANQLLTVTEGGNNCPDADNDTVCDADDICPGHDDLIDSDNDGIPDGCDTACPNPVTVAGNANSIEANDGVSDADEILGAPDDTPAEFYDHQDELEVQLDDEVAAGEKITVSWKYRNYNSSYSGPAKLAVYESTDGGSYTLNATLTTTEKINFVADEITVASNTKFLKLVNASTSGSPAPDFDVDATSYSYISCGTACTAFIEHIDPVDASDCNSNDGQIIVDPFVNQGTALPFNVIFTSNGQMFNAGPFNNAGDNFITGLAAGVYSNITLIDANGCTADGGTLTINCTPTNGGNTVCARIATGSDDAEEKASGNMKIGSTDLELIDDNSIQKVGMRFINLNIPAGANINNAFIQFTTDETNNINPTNLQIFGQDSDNAATFVSTGGNISSRPKTSASVSWSPAEWLSVGESSPAQKSVNIGPIIQEIVNRSGYTANSSIVIIIEGTGKRVAESFEGNANKAPELCVTYGCNDSDGDGTCDSNDLCVGGPEPGTPCDDGDPNTLNDVITANCNCAGAAITYDCPTLQTNIGDVCDDGNPNTFNDMINASCQCEGIPAGSTVTSCSRIITGSDDAEEKSFGQVKIGSSDLELINDNNVQKVGLRFVNLNIPSGANINNAFIQFMTDETKNQNPISLQIYGQDSDNPVTFMGSNGDISSRPKTSATINWAPADWLSVGEAGPNQQTVDIAPIIQEIVNRSGYTASSSIVIIIEGTGKRVAESFEGGANKAPELCITYGCTDSDGDGTCNANDLCPGGPEPGTPCNDGDPNTTNDVISANCLCEGTAPTYDCPGLQANVGDSCDDGDVNTTDDVVNANCICEGTPPAYDCPTLQANFGDSCDDGDANTNNDVINANCECAGTAVGTGTVTSCARIIASSDDAEEHPSGSVSTTSGDLELVLESSDSTDQIVGLRFVDLNIPHGAVISDAYVQFTADATIDYDPIILSISGEASDNAATFSSANGNISSRPKTTATASWSPADWLAIGDAGAAQQTVNIGPIIQEIVNRSGYTSASSIVIMIEGTGKRTAVSFNGDPLSAPELCVTFNCDDADGDGTCDANDLCPNGPEPGTPCDDGNAATTNDMIDANCACTGTVITYDCPGLQANFGDSCDDGDSNTINDQINSNCQCEGTPAGSTITSCVQIDQSSDDAEEFPSGSIKLASGDLELVYESSLMINQVVGMRFNDLNIPQGAVISNAFIQFTAEQTDNINPSDLTIYGEASDNAVTFANVNSNISSRPKTMASANWSPPSWGSTGSAGAAEQSVDISAIIQEIVNRSGYTAGSSIVIIVEGIGKRTAVSFDATPASAPELCITYGCEDLDNDGTCDNNDVCPNGPEPGSPCSTGGSGTDVTLTADFENDTNGYTSQNSGGDDWFRGTEIDASSSFWTVPNNGSTYLFYANDDACNCDMSDVKLISPVMDFSTFTAASLSFDVHFEGNTYQTITETGAVEVSINNGAFTNLANIAGIENIWRNETLDLSAFAGISNVRIAFRYSDNGGWLYGMAIDNVVINGTAPASGNMIVDENCNCVPDLGGNTISTCARIIASTDDAEEKPSGAVSTSSGDIELVLESSDSTDQVVGLRFVGLDIPQGAVIHNASIQFTADATVDYDPIILTITGEASDNALTFSTANSNISNRLRTSTSATWSPADWLTIGDAGAAQQTVDLSQIIQEIVDRTGYATSSAIALILEGTGKRTATSFDGSAATAPELCIDYSVPSNILSSSEYATLGEENVEKQSRGLIPSKLKVYPTPATDHITVSFDIGTEAGRVPVQIRDAQGKVIHTYTVDYKHGRNEIRFDELGIRGGVYFIQFYFDNFIRNAKFIIINED